MSLFKRNKYIHCFDEIVKDLYDKDLMFSDDLEIVKVIYSKDRSKRFILLKSKNGYYKYTYEEIYVYDEDEWNKIGCKVNSYPAFWEPKDSKFGHSFFGTEDEAMSSLVHEAEYKSFFY